MVEEISPDALHERLANGESVQIVDIRPPDDFAAGHIEGAENLPFDRFARDVNAHDWSDDIVVVCPIGQSSLQAARLLEAFEGVDEDARIANLSGGYRDWEYGLVSGDDD